MPEGAKNKIRIQNPNEDGMKRGRRQKMGGWCAKKKNTILMNVLQELKNPGNTICRTIHCEFIAVNEIVAQIHKTLLCLLMFA